MLPKRRRKEKEQNRKRKFREREQEECIRDDNAVETERNICSLFLHSPSTRVTNRSPQFNGCLFLKTLPAIHEKDLNVEKNATEEQSFPSHCRIEAKLQDTL